MAEISKQLLKDIQKLYKDYGKIEKSNLRIENNKLIIKVKGNIPIKMLQKNIKNFRYLHKKYGFESILLK